MNAAAPDRAAPTGAFLSCRELHAYYGESYIVQGTSFDVAEQEVVALLGRNGAGKTSILRTIARANQPTLKRGHIHLAGAALHDYKDYQAARAGVALVPEDRRIVAGLSVEENITIARIAPRAGWATERIFEHFPRLGQRRRQEATTLSGGEQQMLALARALARDVRLFLLDEPYEGLAPQIVQEIERIVEEVKRLGITTIIVEQNALAALELADRAIIIDMGEVVFTGSAREVLDNKDLRDEYLAI
jgi:branched-chain amino acid transport system ATP-binding protein